MVFRMQRAGMALVTVLLTACAAVAGGAWTDLDMSPVTRIVELLQGLGEKAEEELKVEAELFKRFQCWAKSVISQKTASNEAAASQKQSLETYVADLDAGKIELTTERVDLEKDIAGLTADIQQATDLRNNENANYLAAKAEMEQAVAALDQAIGVLDAGTKAGSLLRLHTSAHETQGGIAALKADAQSVSMMLDIASRSLSKGDALFLRRVLTGEVPVQDWKKLNRKATFKDKYEARSGNIQKTLKGLLDTFKDSLDEAEKTEAKAVSLHTTLMNSKQDQKSKAEAALEAMEVEGSARGLSRSESMAPIEALGNQITSDSKYISETQSTLDTKAGEWSVRQKIRSDEIAAINEAISILHSDDARDAMKKSIKSQGYSLVQGSRRSEVVKIVQAHAVVAGGRFDAVIQSIDKMTDALKAEEETDLKRKEGCEKARAEDTRQAAVISRAMDELTDTITRLKTEIEELNGQMKEKSSAIEAIHQQLADAARNREDEKKAWETSDAEDRDAVALIEKAIDVLKKFYSSLTLLQRQSRGSRQPVEGMAAGAAPPPPPSTWETPYAGKKDEQQGVSAILGLIKDDIESDRAKAKEEEDASQSAYDKFKLESEGQITAVQGSITELQGVVGNKEGEVQNNMSDRSNKRAELEAVMTKIKDVAPGCDFFAVNFHVRVEGRQTELDGLRQAKQVLRGASFQ